MIFKAIFNVPIDESNQENIQIEYDPVVSNEVIYFNNHEFEISRDSSGLIKEITYCNQCVQTFDIEDIFLEVISYLLKGEETVTVIDSSGFEEILTRDELLQN